MSVAFAHSGGYRRLLEACERLSAEQLEARPGTYGSIIETLRHLVADEAF